MNRIKVNGEQKIPGKIICVARNYVDHIRELNNSVPDELVFFLKPNSSISKNLNSFHQEQLHYEGELCFLFDGEKFSAVGFGFDLTKRELQSQLKTKGLPWERAKSFDGSAVFSDFVRIDEINDKLNFELSINGEIKQKAGVDLMLNKPADILKQIQSFMTLEDGDIVMTGTPKGVGAIQVGEAFQAQVFQEDTIIIREVWQAQ